MQKTNSNLTVKLIDSNGYELGYTYPKRAKGLIKSGRACYVDEYTICLTCPPKILEDNKKMSSTKETQKKKGLSKISIPKYSLSEELMNAISHGIGALLSCAITVLCIIWSAKHHNPYAIVSSAIYGGTSLILYTISTLYHAFKVNKAKKVFRIIDHCSIYLLIAGTYTPYALVTLRASSLAIGWTVFGIIWLCAIIGITFTAIDMNKFKIPGMVLYIIMGWMIIFTFKTLIANINIKGIYYMIAAGIIYTIGAILYGVGKKIKYMHSIFHFFVVIASVLFFFSIFFYVI